MLFQLIQRRRRRGWLCGSDDEVMDGSVLPTKTNSKSGGGNRFSVADTRTGSSSTAGDESSSNDSRSDGMLVRTAPIPVPEWKAENFLARGRLVESDWWEDCDDASSCSSSSDSSDHDGSCFSDDDESRVSTDVEQLQKYYYEQLENERRQNTSTDSWPKHGKRFCNRGLQTWSQARQAWLSPEQRGATKKKKAPRIPESFRKELIQCLIERRQFELSQSIPLSCVVNAYEEVWNENGCD